MNKNKNYCIVVENGIFNEKKYTFTYDWTQH